MLLLKMGPEVPSGALRRSEKEDGHRPSEFLVTINMGIIIPIIITKYITIPIINPITITIPIIITITIPTALISPYTYLQTYNYHYDF